MTMLGAFEACRICKRETKTVGHEVREDVIIIIPVCDICGACKCDDCLDKAKSMLKKV